jgi:hypothetical protein
LAASVNDDNIAGGLAEHVVLDEGDLIARGCHARLGQWSRGGVENMTHREFELPLVHSPSDNGHSDTVWCEVSVPDTIDDLARRTAHARGEGQSPDNEVQQHVLHTEDDGQLP